MILEKTNVIYIEQKVFYIEQARIDHEICIQLDGISKNVRFG